MVRAKKKPKKGRTAPKRAAAWKSKPPVSPFDKDESGVEFANAVKRLLEIEGAAAGLSPHDIHSNVRNNTPDQGVDAWIKRAFPSVSPLDVKRSTVFQFKRSLPSPSAIFSEIRDPAHEFLRRQLAAGDDYVLAVGAEVVDPVVIERALAAEIGKSLPGWSGTARVWSASTLIGFFRRGPATIRLVVPIAPEARLADWAEWARDGRFAVDQFVWTPDPPRQDLIQAFAAQARSRRAWRVIGKPGVGKSRFVLELTRAFASDVLVARNFSANLASLSDLRLGWLVVDECTDDQHEQLAGMLPASVGLITIGPDTQPRSDAGARLRLEPIESEAAASLLNGSHLPTETRDEIVRRAGGYPKLIRLYADAVSSRGGSVQRHADLNTALTAFIEQHADLEAVETWALPTNATTAEITALATRLRGGSQEIAVGRARAWLDDQGLLGTIGGEAEALHYVTPLLFADWLAFQLWRAAPDALLAALESSAQAMRHNCFRRLWEGVTDLQQCLARLEPARIGALLSPADVARVAEQVARVDRTAAFALVRGLLHPGGTDENRKAAQSALRSLAWFPETFERAVELLLSVVEPHRNTALTDLFGTFLGLTRADGKTRLAVLRGMAAAHPGHALECAAEAISIEGGRFASGLPGSMDEVWRPSDRDAEREYKSGAVAVLVSLLEASPQSDDVRIACERALRPLFRRGFGELGRPLVEAFVRLHQPVTALAGVLRVVERHDLAQLNELRAAHEALVREFDALLIPTTLDERVMRIVEDSRWESIEASNAPSEVRELANELVRSLSHAPTIVRLMNSHGGPGYLEFGRLCALADERHLLEGVLTQVGATARNPQFAVGYFLEWPALALDEKLAQWRAQVELRGFVFKLIHRLPATAARASLLVAMVESGELAAERLGELYFGAWTSRLEAEAATRLMDLAAPPARLLLADQWAGTDQTRTAYVVEAWYHVTASDLRSDTMVDYVWSTRAADALAHRDRFAQALLKRMSEAGEEVKCSHSLPQVVQQWLDHDADALTLLLDRMKDDDKVVWPLMAGRVRINTGAEAIQRATEWARSNRADARLATRLSNGLDGLAIALLNALPDDSRLAADLRSASFSGSWVGAESTYWSSRAERLEAMSDASHDVRAKRRFREWAAIARERATLGKQVETAYDASAIELPLAGSR